MAKWLIILFLSAVPLFSATAVTCGVSSSYTGFYSQVSNSSECLLQGPGLAYEGGQDLARATARESYALNGNVFSFTINTSAFSASGPVPGEPCCGATNDGASATSNETILLHLAATGEGFYSFYADGGPNGNDEFEGAAGGLSVNGSAINACQISTLTTNCYAYLGGHYFPIDFGSNTSITLSSSISVYSNDFNGDSAAAIDETFHILFFDSAYNPVAIENATVTPEPSTFAAVAGAIIALMLLHALLKRRITSRDADRPKHNRNCYFSQ